jgi:hypothetical protein
MRRSQSNLPAWAANEPAGAGSASRPSPTEAAAGSEGSGEVGGGGEGSRGCDSGVPAAFLACGAWAGAVAGYAFRAGAYGQGYYLENAHAAAAAAEPSPAVSENAAAAVDCGAALAKVCKALGGSKVRGVENRRHVEQAEWGERRLKGRVACVFFLSGI